MALDYGNYGIFLNIMGNAGFILLTVGPYALQGPFIARLGLWGVGEQYFSTFRLLKHLVRTQGSLQYQQQKRTGSRKAASGLSVSVWCLPLQPTSHDRCGPKALSRVLRLVKQRDGLRQACQNACDMARHLW